MAPFVAMNQNGSWLLMASHFHRPHGRSNAATSMAFSVYIIELTNGTYYVGHTNNLHRRMQEHRDGIACAHTKKFPMHRLLWSEMQPDRRLAATREREIKGWSRKKKQALWNESVGLS